MAISWNFYCKRRRIDVKRWIALHNIKSYKGMCKVLESMGIIPPDKDDVADLFKRKAAPKPKPAKVPKKSNKSPKPTKTPSAVEEVEEETSE